MNNFQANWGWVRAYQNKANKFYWVQASAISCKWDVQLRRSLNSIQYDSKHSQWIQEVLPQFYTNEIHCKLGSLNEDSINYMFQCTQLGVPSNIGDDDIFGSLNSRLKQ